MWLIFNGEIYNFKLIKNQLEKCGHQFYTESDTEVVIHAYEQWGLKAFKKFRGPFAFCLYDSTKEMLYLVRDRIGLKPLYYYFDGEMFIFGSEIKSLLCHEIKRELELKALNLYLSLKFVPFNITLFKKIYKVPSSSYLEFNLKERKIKIEKYHELEFCISTDKTESELAKELRNIVEESIKIRLISDVPLGAFLSGGIDSTSVVGIMSKFLIEPVKTFSVVFEKGIKVDESKYSRLVAEHFKTDHTEITLESSYYQVLPHLIWYLDDLIADPAIIPVHYMAKLAKKEISVALTGDGADEVFAGYSVYYNSNLSRLSNYMPNYFLKSFMSFYDYIPSFKIRMALSFFHDSKNENARYIRAILNIPDNEMSNVVSFQNYNVKDLIMSTFIENLNIVNQFTNWELNYQLPNYYNMKADKMSMSASLEARTPFLDQEIIKWASRIPPELKLKNNIEKYILRLAMKDIIPREILKRKKQGFGTPVSLWLKKGLKKISYDLFKNLEKRKNIINPEFIKKIRRNRSNRYFEMISWTLLSFELWYETFIEGNGLNPIKI